MLTLSNPSTILSCVAVFVALAGSWTSVSATSSWWLVGGVFTGSTRWWRLLSQATARLGSRLDDRWRRRVNQASAALLVGFAFKRAPQNAVYGSPGAGTMPHFLGSMFARATGVALTHVPYRGGAPMSQDLLGGQVPAAFQPIGFDSVERHRGGKLTVLAVAEPKRSQPLPDVPSFAELGFEGLVVNEWFGLFAPAGTSAATVQLISQRARTAMQQPDIVTWLERGQAGALTSTPEELGARLRSDLQRWGQIVKDSGFQAEE